MLNSLTLSLSRFFNASSSRRQTVAASSRVSPLFIAIGCSLLIVNGFLMFSYLLGVNASASTGYEIQKIQNKLQDDSDQNKKLNLQISEQSSIASVQNDFTQQNYVPVGQVQFLQVEHLSER